MQLKHHAAMSTVISAGVYYLSGSWGLATVSFLSGILMDLDHVIDYVLHHGTRFNIKDFFRFFMEERYTRLTLIFHGWEWLIILFILSWLTGWDILVTGVFIGFSQHLILDKLYNISRFSSYSFFYRLSVGFDPEFIYLKNRKRDVL
jgi:hypothetical protein